MYSPSFSVNRQGKKMKSFIDKELQEGEKKNAIKNGEKKKEDLIL